MQVLGAGSCRKALFTKGTFCKEWQQSPVEVTGVSSALDEVDQRAKCQECLEELVKAALADRAVFIFAKLVGIADLLCEFSVGHGRTRRIAVRPI